jgi:hypothetical protein
MSKIFCSGKDLRRPSNCLLNTVQISLMIIQLLVQFWVQFTLVHFPVPLCVKYNVKLSANIAMVVTDDK